MSPGVAYALFAGSVGLVLTALAAFVARQKGWRPLQVACVLLAFALAMGAGARAHYLIANHPIPFRWDGVLALLTTHGMHMPGGILLALVTSAFVARRVGLSAGQVGDALTPVLGLCLAAVRLRCFNVGCCFGAPTDLPWGVSFGPGTPPFWYHSDRGWIFDDATRTLPVHPTQLYYVGLGVLMTVVGLVWPRFQRRAGETQLFAFGVWGVGTAVVETFRDPDYLTGSPHLGWSALVIGLLAFSGALTLRYLGHRMPSSSLPEPRSRKGEAQEARLEPA